MSLGKIPLQSCSSPRESGMPKLDDPFDDLLGANPLILTIAFSCVIIILSSVLGNVVALFIHVSGVIRFLERLYSFVSVKLLEPLAYSIWTLYEYVYYFSGHSSLHRVNSLPKEKVGNFSLQSSEIAQENESDYGSWDMEMPRSESEAKIHIKSIREKKGVTGKSGPSKDLTEALNMYDMLR
jgi:hypothetical protein